ncbi:EamA family transporter [Granulicella sp. 5B5]|nr:EamA family transporter [Granulicella sp. 5B5]
MPFAMSKSTRVLLAFGSVYLFWGSTYIAIHVAGEQLPVPVVSATRSLISAGLIAVISLARGKSLWVPKDEIWKLILVGILFMSFNNMGLTWGEKMVPTGFASLLISTVAIMIAVLEMLTGGEALNKRGWAGTLLGTMGIGVLVWPSLHAQLTHSAGAASGSRVGFGTLVTLGAAFAFAVGSVLSRRFHFKADTFVATGWQIGAGGVFNALLALATGGYRRAVWTPHGVESIVYLSIFGSLCGLVAFTYLLQNVAVTKVATYAFVNPVIAVMLGVVILHERLAPAELGGMAVIVCAVAMVIYSRVDRSKSEELAAEIVGNAGEAVE